MMDCPLKLFLMSFLWNEATLQDWGNDHEGHDVNTFWKLKDILCVEISIETKLYHLLRD